MKRFAVGVVIKDRWDLTESTLQSVFYSDQPKDSFDLFLIDNGSCSNTKSALRKFVYSGLLPVKNLICIPEVSIPKAWNLFLVLSSQYDYRIKLDNDVVFNNTIVPAGKRPKPRARQSLPGEVDPMRGAPRSASIIKGMGQSRRRKIADDNTLRRDSCFLEHMLEFHEEYNVDLVALTPVSPKESFGNMYQTVTAARFDDRPFLFGACMFITKRAFDTLGYFDERLPRRIDIEYTQRAIRNKLNIGYHPYYGVTHIGAANSTESRQEIDKKYLLAEQVQREEPAITDFADSEWTPISSPLIQEASSTQIISIE